MSRIPFQPGEPAPWFQCIATGRDDYHFSTVAGRYIVISFLGSSEVAASAAVLDYFNTDLRHYFDDDKVAFFGVSIAPNDMQKLQMSLPGMRYFFDMDRKVSRLYRAVAPNQSDDSTNVAYTSFTLILDPNLRVLADIPRKNLQTHNEEVLKILSNLPPVQDYAGVELHAPVLIVPRVFEPGLCKKLIQLYEENGGSESGFMRGKDGNTVGILDSSFKRRKDYDLERGSGNHEAIIKTLQNRIMKRLIPEIHKAFQFKVTRMERYIVACYEGEHKGFFRQHRDNTSKGTAHRQFAATINLNTEEYEGGELVFPEFGFKTYKAPTGGAVVFSCSLLHEATPVTQGTRYAFLPFLYDDQSAEIRQQNQKYLTGETIRV